MQDFVRSWGRATSAEVVWIDASGQPRAVAAVPLLDDSVPCVALTFDRAATGTALAAAGAVGLVLSDSRQLPAGEPGTAAVGPVTVAEDASPLAEELLDQELRKYPPARLLADSLLLRRENWWYLPRVVVRLNRIDRVRELPVRSDPDRAALLVCADGDGLRLDVASADDWSTPVVELRSDDLLRGDATAVLAHGHDHSPDRERWDAWSVRGSLRGDRLEVTERVGRPGLDPRPPGLLERLRRARALEKGCRGGIAAAEERARAR